MPDRKSYASIDEEVLKFEEDALVYHSFLEHTSQVLSSIPSYALPNTIISGRALKYIVDNLKKLGIKLDQTLNASNATLYRQFKKENIDIDVKDNLVSLMRIMEKGIRAFESEENFKEWLVSKIENLGRLRPIDLLSLETGRREVEEAIDRIEYGVYG